VDEGLWEAARCVRPYLTGLVGSDAPIVDAAVAEILNGAHHEDAESQLRSLLESYDGTEAFLERVLEDAPSYRPPQVVAAQATQRGSLSGDSLPVDADKFVCPYGDFAWYLPEVGAPIPRCKTHGPLQPAEGVS
jgi:hypothetical protein